jgi:hypothetical protein
LYPRKIKPPALAHALPDVDAKNKASGNRRKNYHLSGKYRAFPHVARPTVDPTIDLEDFPNQFEALAEEVTTFVHCLNEFPEFTDEAVNTSISSFEGDLKYWASCLHNYSGQFRYPAVQRYIQDLAVEMGEHIDSITSTLSMFIEVGVPTIRFAQKHGATNLLNLSTVSTFFSAVTATTIQFSYQLQSPISAAVNSFWFLSLVFSIAAAVNSLLGLTWKQAMYRSRTPSSLVGSHLDQALSLDFPGARCFVFFYRSMFVHVCVRTTYHHVHYNDCLHCFYFVRSSSRLSLVRF